MGNSGVTMKRFIAQCRLTHDRTQAAGLIHGVPNALHIVRYSVNPHAIQSNFVKIKCEAANEARQFPV